MTTITSTGTGPTRHSAALVAVGGLVAALALAGCGTQVAGGAGAGGTDLPLLHIGAGSARAADAAAPGASTDPYPLTGTLPSSPGSAAVYRFLDTAVSESDVRTLAADLGVDGTPKRHAHGWEVTSSLGTVRVHDGGTAWSFARGTSDCPSYWVDLDNAGSATTSVGCAIAPVPAGTASAPAAGSASSPVVLCPKVSGTTTSTCPSATGTITDQEAMAAARPVLVAVGLPETRAAVLGAYGDTRTVSVDPLVDGRTTVGATTTIEVGTVGVLGATGVLATPVTGPSYPIITAAQALDRLRSMPRPEIAMACAEGAVCPGIGPQPITGASLGLQLSYDGGTPILVPAWLFILSTPNPPIAVIAVQDAYLADPTPSGGDNPASAAPGGPGAAPTPAPGTGGGGSSGEPGTPVPPPDPAIQRVTSVALGKDGSTLLLTFWGGICDVYAGHAEETSTTITVSVSTLPQSGPPKGCAAIAKEVTVAVALAAPWDKRTILDAASGLKIPMS